MVSITLLLNEGFSLCWTLWEKFDNMVNPYAAPDEKVLDSPLLFSSCTEILWLRDKAGVLVFNPARQKYWLLAGLEADLWSWIVLGHSLRQITQHTALIMDLQEESASQRIMQFFQYLVQEEILRISSTYG